MLTNETVIPSTVAGHQSANTQPASDGRASMAALRDQAAGRRICSLAVLVKVRLAPEGGERPVSGAAKILRII